MGHLRDVICNFIFMTKKRKTNRTAR